MRGIITPALDTNTKEEVSKMKGKLLKPILSLALLLSLLSLTLITAPAMATAGNSTALTANANVIPLTIGIQLDRASIDYGNIKPGHNSAVETVRVTNTGDLAVDVTLEVQGNTTDAQNFYEQSLWVNSALYNSSTVLATIPETQHSDVATQLKVPSTWSIPGTQTATFVFWAEAN